MYDVSFGDEGTGFWRPNEGNAEVRWLGRLRVGCLCMTWLDEPGGCLN